MKYCEQCGNALKDDAKFCPGCGIAVASDEPKREEFVDNSQQSIVLSNNGGTDIISEYVSRVMSLEKSVYTQNQTIKQIKCEMNKLGWEKSYRSPATIKNVPLISSDIGDKIFGAVAIGFVIGGIIALFSRNPIWILIGIIVSLAIIVVSDVTENTDRNSEIDEQNQHNLDWYCAAVAADKLRVDAELEEKNKLMEILRTMEEKRDETAEVLDKYYGKDIIFPKYRNFIAICSFFEYFASGRCSELTGRDGAYNIYENETRLDRICTKLDEVIDNLEKVRNNQFYLYEAIQEGNKISQQLLTESVRQSKLAEVTAENSAIAAENSAVTSHYAEITANNTAASAWVDTYNYFRN